MTEFTNEQIDLTTLPSVDDVDFEGLEQNYLTVQLISGAIFWIIIGCSAVIFILMNPWNAPSWIANLLLVLLSIFLLSSFFIIFFGFKKKKYALRTKDVIYQSGLFWRKFSVLPFNRVQHAEVEQGPIERLFNLSKLKIYTAGGASSDMTISGISYERAQAMKFYILRQTATDEEE